TDELHDSSERVEPALSSQQRRETVSPNDGGSGGTFYLGGHCDDGEALARRGHAEPVCLSVFHSRRERSFLSASVFVAESRRPGNVGQRGLGRSGDLFAEFKVGQRNARCVGRRYIWLRFELVL